MDLRSILEDAKIEPIKQRELDSTFTDELPINIELKTIDDLIKMCELYKLPIPTHEMFERESHIENLIAFLRILQKKVLEYDLKLPEIDINDADVQKTRLMESEIDRMEIEIAHMENDYRMLIEFKNEVCKFYNKDVTITTDLVSTSTTYDVRNNNISNVFIDNNGNFSMERGSSANLKENLDSNLIFSFIKTLENILDNLKDNPYIRHRDILSNISPVSFSYHTSYRSYKNLKRKQVLLDKISKAPDSFQKTFFLELIERRSLYLADIQERYGVDRVDIFKLVYMLESRRILVFDQSNERVMLFCD